MAIWLMTYLGDGLNSSYWAYEQERTTEKNIELDKEKQTKLWF